MNINRIYSEDIKSVDELFEADKDVYFSSPEIKSVNELFEAKAAAGAGLRALVQVWQPGDRPTWEDVEATAANHQMAVHASRMADWECGDYLLALLEELGL